MDSLLDTIDKALAEARTLRQALARGRNRQVRSTPERDHIKATIYAWFRNHKTVFPSKLDTSTADHAYSMLLKMAERNTARARYKERLQFLIDELGTLRTATLHMGTPAAHDEEAPDFSPLIASKEMRAILLARWDETRRCVEVGAPLAATVMMGGILEGLLLARANRLDDKSPMFKTKTAPRNKDGSTKPLQEWMLKDYIEVAHELGWIRRSAKDIGAVVKDYRNYIHPAKQLSHAIHISDHDARLFWAVFSELSKQIIAGI